MRYLKNLVGQNKRIKTFLDIQRLLEGWPKQFYLSCH